MRRASPSDAPPVVKPAGGGRLAIRSRADPNDSRRCSAMPPRMPRLAAIGPTAAGRRAPRPHGERARRGAGARRRRVCRPARVHRADDRSRRRCGWRARQAQNAADAARAGRRACRSPTSTRDHRTGRDAAAADGRRPASDLGLTPGVSRADIAVRLSAGRFRRHRTVRPDERRRAAGDWCAPLPIYFARTVRRRRRPTCGLRPRAKVLLGNATQLSAAVGHPGPLDRQPGGLPDRFERYLTNARRWLHDPAGRRRLPSAVPSRRPAPGLDPVTLASTTRAGARRVDAVAADSADTLADDVLVSLDLPRSDGVGMSDSERYAANVEQLPLRIDVAIGDR